LLIRMSHPIGPASADSASVLLAWSAEPAVTIPVAVAAALYWRGWMALSRRLPHRFGPLRLLAFMAGLAVVVLAVCSPIDALGRHLLRAHMTQHLLLMLVAPPLLWAGAPLAPLLLGLPRPLRRMVAGILAASPMRRLTAWLTHPAVGWVLFVVAFWLWHVPALYELALRSDGWHHVEHMVFFGTAMLFWRPVILAWPARSPWPRWAMIPYLVLAEMQNTALAAILTFSDRVVYPAYLAAPRAGGLSPLEDQAVAGLIMWVPGSLAFLIPVLWLVITGLHSPDRGADRTAAIDGQPALRRR
jgi:cytochrome c oxidase assembly factor CtaG